VTTTAWGVQVLQAVNSPRVKLLYDIYHMQIMDGRPGRHYPKNVEWLGHFHTGCSSPAPSTSWMVPGSAMGWRDAGIAGTNYSGYVATNSLPTRDPLTSLRQAVDLCDV